MPRKRTRWWPAIGVLFGLATWLTLACLWLFGMATLYVTYAWFGGKALIAAALALFALMLHFQLRDIERGGDGDYMHKWSLALWQLFRRLWGDG